jgi:3-dehydroquinate synthase
MVASVVSKFININSHKGEYTVSFISDNIDKLNSQFSHDNFYIVDQNISKIYKHYLSNILNSNRVLIIEASEKNKSLDKFPIYVDKLIEARVRRGQNLIAIGGGIIQDITCFLATTMMRGLPWFFYPTTLLAQSDSCIGSKSSINSGEVKNILGTFTPPNKVIIDINFLKSLEEKDILSGIGEMIKVHAINSPESFDLLSENYENIKTDPFLMEKFIYQSLLMKKKLIEIDEFDLGPRNLMNYGHSFGHAIETATNYEIPHGIAVTIGMDIANFVAASIGISSQEHFERMHTMLDKNCSSYRHIKINPELIVSALNNDKKNSPTQLRLILPNKKGNISIGLYNNDVLLMNALIEYFNAYSKAA